MSFIFTNFCKIFGHASLGQMTVATFRGAVEKSGGGAKNGTLMGKNVQTCLACLLQNHNYGAKGATKLANQSSTGLRKHIFLFIQTFKARLVRSETPLFKKNFSARYARYLWQSKFIVHIFQARAEPCLGACQGQKPMSVWTFSCADFKSIFSKFAKPLGGFRPPNPLIRGAL